MKRDSDSADTRELLGLMERLAGLKPEDRRSELARIAAEQPALAARLTRMLDRIEQAAAWFDGLEQALGRGLAAELDSAWAPGRVIGAYRLERLLATGGMDAVFVARKADGELKRPVALKLVPAGLVNDETVARFRRERDLLAGLVHPNIAALLDAGISDDGQPWFAMEYIEGVRFDHWSERESTGRTACMRQFHVLAEAVAFAHRNLVVHGDLKPGNVMIGKNGRLRLLDFGIARLMNEIPREDAPRYFTTRYAAPERRTGSHAGTASDVYSLGVMLRDIVAARDWGRGSAGRDLAAIATRASADKPEQRFESARGLADDIQRWLRGEPVLAREGGIGYRLGRRARRHPVATAGIAVAVAALLAFGAVSRFQAERYARERDKARELAGFLEQVFVSADPETERGEPLTARQLLDRGRERLDNETTDPAVRVEFLSILGRTYQRLGDYRTAGQLLDQALALDAGAPDKRVDLMIERAETHRLAGEFDLATAAYREVLDGARELDGARRARALGGLGRTLAQAGKPADAVPLLEDSLARTRELADVDIGVLADRLNDTGSALFRLGRFERAVERLEEALALRRRLDRDSGRAEGSPRTATLVNNLGLMFYLQGRPERSERLLREALAMRGRVLPADHPDVAQTLTNLGLMLKDYGDSDEAVRMLERALDVRRASLVPGHYRIGQAMLNLGTAYRKAGRLGPAEALLRDALAGLVATMGPRNPQVAVAHNELGSLLLDLQRPEAADAAHRKALSIQRDALPPEHPHLAWSLLGLGRALLAQGRTDAARPLLEEAVAIRNKALPEDDPLRVEAENELARAMARKSRY